VFKYNIVFTAHKPAVMTRGMEINEKWGKEIDFNLFTSSHHDRLMFATNQCDLNSIVTDPKFKDPGKGDYTAELGSKALDQGFVNFDMRRFGVVTPYLRSIVKTPEFPEVQISPDTTHVELPTGEVTLWKGAHIFEPVGKELSAYGVKMGSRGVALAYVSTYSEAYSLGFRTGDFVREINEIRTESISGFIDETRKNTGKGEVVFTLTRDQVLQELKLVLGH